MGQLVVEFSSVTLVMGTSVVSIPRQIAFLNGGIKGDRGIPGENGPPGQMPPGVLLDVVYDGSSRVVSYTLDGVGYTVSYPDALTVRRTGNGKVRQATLDTQGRIISVAVTPI